MCWVYNVTGVWVYPLLEHIDTLSRAVFFICLTALTSLYYIIGEILNNYIWDSSRNQDQDEDQDQDGDQDQDEDQDEVHVQKSLITESSTSTQNNTS
ncbi:hypothetical protein QTP86_006506 [Hemibagrus guttatus]|nr:hypothetical protein QTP86_006506 [Hemibagrus guttatus]